jgi:hypothetical protein
MLGSNISDTNTTIERIFFLTNDYDQDIYIPVGNNLGNASAGFDFITSPTLVGGEPQYPIWNFGLIK